MSSRAISRMRRPRLRPSPTRTFRTGDLGQIEDGFVRIVGRKKDVLVTAGARTSHRPVETTLEGGPIEAAVVIGMIGPTWWHSSRSRPVRMRTPFRRTLTRRCTLCAEQIKRWAPMAEVPSEDNGLLTPTLKLKRRVVLARYADLIDGLYDTARRSL